MLLTDVTHALGAAGTLKDYKSVIFPRKHAVAQTEGNSRVASVVLRL